MISTGGRSIYFCLANSENQKTMKTTIITLAFVSFFITNILAASNPDKDCSKTTTQESCQVMSLSVVCLASLSPATPLEATFEDAELNADALMNYSYLRPETPKEADFSDPAMSPDLKPAVPVLADFNDSPDVLPSDITSSSPNSTAVTNSK